MQRGRRPKPTVLRLIESRPLKRTNEPKPKGPATKPYDLDEVASAIWDTYAPQMIELGLLTALDSEQFASWCRISAKIRQAPTARLSSNDIAQQRLLAATFGMAPSERARISVSEKEQAKATVGMR
jgi:phage terminase small subunit